MDEIPDDIRSAAVAVVDRGYDTGLIDAVAQALTAERRRERNRCITVALEHRCERGTAWDLACTTIAADIMRKTAEEMQ